MERGQLVPDEHHRRVLPRPARASPTPPTARSSTASRGRGPRPRPSTPRSRRAAAQVDRAMLHRRPDRGARPPAGGPLDLQRDGPRLPPEPSNPPRSPASATSTARALVQRDGRPGRRPSGPGWPAARRRCSRSSTTTARRGVLRSVDGRQPIDEVSAERPRRRRPARPAAAGRPDGHPQVASARSRRCAVAGRIVAEVLALVEAELEPGVSTGHLDRLAERHIRVGRRDPVVQGLPGATAATRSRRASASRSTTRSSTASPASGRSGRARSCRSTPARSSTAGTATAPGPSSSATPPAEVARAHRHDPARR